MFEKIFKILFYGMLLTWIFACILFFVIEPLAYPNGGGYDCFEAQAYPEPLYAKISFLFSLLVTVYLIGFCLLILMGLPSLLKKDKKQLRWTWKYVGLTGLLVILFFSLSFLFFGILNFPLSSPSFCP